jgi:hypothetical protein
MDRREIIDSMLLKKPTFIKLSKQKIKKGSMGITDAEVEYICSKADSSKIKLIILVNGNRCPSAFTHQGMLHISRIRWDSLTSLNLGEYSLI